MMADEPQKIIVQSSRIDATILPPGFSQAYKLYVIQQTTDIKNITDASNNANELAYEATQKNAEQDITLADHTEKLAALRSEVDDHEIRIIANSGSISSLSLRVSSAEGNITSIQSNLTSLTLRVSTAESNITLIQGDYVSKSATFSQSLSSPLNVATSYSVNGTKVVGARQTGWTAATGTALLDAFNANQVFTVSNPPTQAEVQAIATALVANRQRTKALEDALRNHGLIN